MHDDAEVLDQYVGDRSESAFSELIRRHVDLVYSTALRQVGGDVHWAEDVTQQVFSEFARQAHRLRRHPALSGWLYTTARWMALRSTRTEQRRRVREQETKVMNELLGEPVPELDWDRLHPVLDEAMHGLNERDRLTVVLRFFQNKSLKEVGTVLGLNENAARKRVERSLDKLRVQLTRKGVTSTAGALAVMLGSHAVTAAPSSFVATLTSTALAGVATSTGTSISILNLMTMTKLKIGLVSAIVIGGVATSVVVEREAQAKLRQQDEALQQQADQLAQTEAERERLSNLVAVADRSPANLLDELRRLRDEVAVLQKRASDLAALREEESKLRASLNRARTKFREDLHGPADQRSVDSPQLNARTDYCMRLGGAMSMYASQHGQFPTNLAQLASIMSTEWGNRTNFAGFTPDQFEIVFQGPLPAPDKYAHPNDIIRIREKQPWRNTDGKWVKVYTMLSGLGMVHSEPDGNFEAWERRRIVPPEASKP